MYKISESFRALTFPPASSVSQENIYAEEGSTSLRTYILSPRMYWEKR